MTRGFQVCCGKMCGFAWIAGCAVLGSLALTGRTPGTPSDLRAAENRAAAEDSATPELPPLVVDKAAPLLLADPSSKQDAEQRAQIALNAACFVCHGNYEQEPLVRMHAAEEIGCVDCHGPSFAHRNDENNITPPDVLYPLEAIDAACEECHDSHDVAATDVLARWQQRCPQKRDVSQIVCTDCHGEHRLKHRTVRWDKTTGKLIPPEKKPQPPAAQ